MFSVGSGSGVLALSPADTLARATSLSSDGSFASEPDFSTESFSSLIRSPRSKVLNHNHLVPYNFATAWPRVTESLHSYFDPDPDDVLILEIATSVRLYCRYSILSWPFGTPPET